MKIPKEVILDLLPVYLAGEASPATKAWIEAYLAEDPELAELARRQSVQGLDPSVQLAVPPELELTALRRTRRIMLQMRWLFGAGMAFTAIALALEIRLRPAVKVRLLLLDHPAQLGPCLLIAIACWTAYSLLQRRLRL